jgi:hypothetical protein
MQAVFLLELLFNPENGRDIFFETWLEFQQTTQQYALDDTALEERNGSNVDHSGQLENSHKSSKTQIIWFRLRIN